jgi:hypothetical protein
VFLLRQRLLHFLLFGAALFVVFSRIGGEGGRDSRTVVVDREALARFLQFRSTSFDDENVETQLAAMSDEELATTIDQLIREEVLHREALALGLDRDDYILRQRLVQKLEFVTRGFADTGIEISDDDARAYFEEHQREYDVPPHVTFAHVYFDLEKHGADGAAALAKEKLEELNAAGVPLAGAAEHSDPFLYHVDYVERYAEYVAGHLGPALAAAVFEVPAGDGRWRGPYESLYGFHLALVSRREEGRASQFAEVEERVREDVKAAVIAHKAEVAIDAIIDGYDVRVVYERPREAGPGS